MRKKRDKEDGYRRAANDWERLHASLQNADEFIGCPEISGRESFAARVHGDTMTPHYEPGDTVIFDPALYPKDGDACFVRMQDGTTTFKAVFFDRSDPDNLRLRLQPLNAKYPFWCIPVEEVSGIYVAKFRYQRVNLRGDKGAA